MEIKVKIVEIEKFIKKYRNYKLDQIDGGKPDYEMEVFRNVMEESGTTIAELSPYDNAEISSIGGIVDGSYGETQQGGFDLDDMFDSM